MRRRPEAYHDTLREADTGEVEDADPPLRIGLAGTRVNLPLDLRVQSIAVVPRDGRIVTVNRDGLITAFDAIHEAGLRGEIGREERVPVDDDDRRM